MIEQVLVADAPDVLESDGFDGLAVHDIEAVAAEKGIHVVEVAVAAVQEAGPVTERPHHGAPGRDVFVAGPPSLRMETVGIGGIELAKASRPRTVRVPDAYAFANHNERAANASKFGMRSRAEPCRRLNSAPKDSLETNTTLSRPRPPGARREGPVKAPF